MAGGANVDYWDIVRGEEDAISLPNWKEGVYKNPMRKTTCLKLRFVPVPVISNDIAMAAAKMIKH